MHYFVYILVLQSSYRYALLILSYRCIVIILTYVLVGLTSQMLYSKSRFQRPSDLEENNFKCFLPYMSVAAILVM